MTQQNDELDKILNQTQYDKQAERVLEARIDEHEEYCERRNCIYIEGYKKQLKELSK